MVKEVRDQICSHRWP